MTINTPPTPLSYAGDDTTVDFPITWKYISKSHVKVTLRDTNDVENSWVLGTQFELTDENEDTGGTLTVNTVPDDYTPATGEVLIIEADIPFTQESALPLGGDFPSSTVENMDDLDAQRLGQLNSKFDRTFLVPTSDAQVGQLLLPIDTSRAGKYLGFDGVGKPVAIAGDTDTAVDLSDRTSTPGFTNAVARTFADSRKDLPHIFDWIPVSQHAGIEARTSTYDAASDIADAIADIAPTTNDGNRLKWCKGEVRVASTITLPTFVQFQGVGGRQSVIKALSPFTGSYVVQLGSTGVVFDCYLDSMRVSANDIAGLIPVYSNRINEGAGLRNCVIRDFDRTGIFIEHTGSNEAQNYLLDSLEVFPNNNDEISISSITETGGTATANSVGHGWSAGDVFTLKGASPDGYKGVKKVATAATDSFTFAVESGIGSASGTIVASRRICIRLDVNNASKMHVRNCSLVASADGAGIGMLINKAMGNITAIHCEKMSVGLATGLDDSSLGLEVNTFHGRTDLEVVVQVNANSFAVVNLRNIMGAGGSATNVHDSLYGLRFTDGAMSYETGSGAQPDGVLITSGTGAKGIQLRSPLRSEGYTVAQANALGAGNAGAGATIYVTDDVGGAVPAFSDGTDWRRCTDRAVISTT